MDFARIFDALWVAVFGTTVVFFLLLSLSIYVRIQSFVLNNISSFCLQNSKKDCNCQTKANPKHSESLDCKLNNSSSKEITNNTFPKINNVEDYCFKINEKKYFINIQKIED